MARARGKKRQGVEGGPAAGGAGRALKAHEVTGPMRLLLHLLESRLGLFPADSGFDGRGRFRAPALLTGNASMPAAMREIFAEELSGLQRVGIAADGCHVASIAGLRVFSLSFYYFDGFNAILYAERERKMFAAWKEQEMNPDKSPATILTPCSYEELLTRLREVLQVAPAGAG